DEPAIPLETLVRAISKASRGTRTELREKAREARRAPGVKEDVLYRAREVFRALTLTDAENVDHESHGHLASILDDLGTPEEAVKEFDRAIGIRDRRGKTGWSYWNLRRALINMRLDKDTPSKTETREAILADLKRARSDLRIHEDWEKCKGQIQTWLQKN